jgi:ABC-2 type transport system permease protein
VSALRRYLALASATVQIRMAYRTAFLLGVISNILILLSLYYLWRTLYAGRDTLGGFSWAEMQTYLVLTFATNLVVGWYTEITISVRILDGSVAIDLLKPVDFQFARLAETVAGALFEGAIALVIVGVIAVGLGGLLLPPNALVGLLSGTSFVLGLLVKFGVVYLCCLFSFWTVNGWGIFWARDAVMQLFSGALVPLPFLPGWLRTIAEWSPFPGMVYLPTGIYLGRIGPAAAGWALLGQAAWAVALLFVGRWAWHGAMRKVTIHGG